MNSILGFTNVLFRTNLNEEQKGYISAIKESGDALLIIINDILDITKVDAGKMVFEKTGFNLFKSVSTTLHLIDDKIKEKNLEYIKEFDTGIPEIVVGDAVRLRQILLNLVSNAAKFTNHGRITVSIHKLKEDAETVTLEFIVKDTGIGIPKDKQENIFNSFEQATNDTSRLYGGTGLGLAIVKKFVELQGGTVSLESEPGKGSSFGFVLSFGKTETKLEKENEEVLNLKLDIKNAKVLVAEDNHFNQLLIKKYLTDFGFIVDIADNGKMAIEKMKETKYEFILMDIQMPEMNGFEATSYIRNTLKSDIPIIALTADITLSDVEKSKEIGMNDYLSKPIDEELLFKKIIKYLKPDSRDIL